MLGDAFSFEKVVHGDVTVLTLRGTLNDAFDGRKLADAVKTPKAIVVMRGVRRFASWGMTEWLEFLRLRRDRDIYLADCSTYSVSQLILVTGLLGHAKLLSFLASYRCATCAAELEQLFVVPRDGESILDLPNTPRTCAKCSGVAMLEAYPASFFETIAARPSFDIDDSVLAVLQQKFRYDLAPDTKRFRAFSASDGEQAYLRLSGNVGQIPAQLAMQVHPSSLIDLRGIVYDPGDLVAWRHFLDDALARASVQLDGCPEGFLEHGTTVEQLHGTLRIRSFDARYDCLTCERAVACPVDVATHLEQLVEGMLPPAQCPTCKSALVPAPQPGLLQRMRALPARDRSPALDKLVARVATKPSSQLTNCLLPAKAEPPKRKTRWPYVAGALALVGAGAAAAFVLANRSEKHAAAPVTPAVASAAPVDASEKPQFVRPEWILSDTPASAYCHDLINRLMCVGVSSYRSTRDLAATEANDAALEELVNAVGIKIDDAAFRESIVPSYNAVRSKDLGGLQAADLDRATDKYEKLLAGITESRARVARILHTSGGPAVPTQRSDWYWEEYAGDAGTRDTLVFVRYDVSLDAVRSLMTTYTRDVAFMGGTARSGFPGSAWNVPGFQGGILVTKLGRRLRDAKVAIGDYITAIDDQLVSDVDLAVRLVEANKKPKLTVLTPGTEPRTVQLR